MAPPPTVPGLLWGPALRADTGGSRPFSDVRRAQPGRPGSWCSGGWAEYACFTPSPPLARAFTPPGPALCSSRSGPVPCGPVSAPQPETPPGRRAARHHGAGGRCGVPGGARGSGGRMSERVSGSGRLHLPRVRAAHRALRRGGGQGADATAAVLENLDSVFAQDQEHQVELSCPGRQRAAHHPVRARERRASTQRR